NHTIGRSLVELGGIRLLQPADVARELDHHGLHSQADPEIRDLVFARVADGLQHSLDSAASKSARNQDAVEGFELPAGFWPFEPLGLDPGDIDLGVMREPAM